MSRLIILGATGSLGRVVAGKALAAGYDLSVVVRAPSRLASEIAAHASVHQADLSTIPRADLARVIAGHDALISCAGLVTEGQVFVSLFDHVVSSAEAVPDAERPACWFLAGAALLELDDSGRRGIELPEVKATYWPHAANFERLRRSTLDWRLLCPGPMVDRPGIGLEHLRVSRDTLPVPLPPDVHSLPAARLLPLFLATIPEMIIPYADAASVMLANTSPGGAMTHHRVGIALPAGMRGQKDQWTARPGNPARHGTDSV
jgi:putative NADH-flavin reductase